MTGCLVRSIKRWMGVRRVWILFAKMPAQRKAAKHAARVAARRSARRAYWKGVENTHWTTAEEASRMQREDVGEMCFVSQHRETMCMESEDTRYHERIAAAIE